MTTFTTVTNWGNYPRAAAEILEVSGDDAVRDAVMTREHVLARGNGKCYGDAALGPCLLSTLRLNRILQFDPETGVITCESGVLLADVLHLALPDGWFFHVTPGIKNITVGGAIACDVHGKNHPEKGCFSNWLLAFDLMDAEGRVIRCSPMENASLFWQTCGGMGWTGIILRASFQLMRVQSADMLQTSVRADNLDELFRAFEAGRHHPYAAGWIDCLSGGKSFGRGVVFFGRHDERPGVLALPDKKVGDVPYYAPSWLLNPLSIRLHNQLLFSRVRTGEKRVHLDQYFYPLDRISNWNRLYGRRGFVQYQFCLPENQSAEGIRRLLEHIKTSGHLPFLTVLKRHGDKPAEAVHSFPIQGYSLALDFPWRQGILKLVQDMDELVWKYGGRIYLAKDACSAARMGRVDPRGFGHPKFHSLLKARLLAS